MTASAGWRPHEPACAPSTSTSRHRPTATPNRTGSPPLHGSPHKGGYTHSGPHDSATTQSGTAIIRSLQDGSWSLENYRWWLLHWPVPNVCVSSLVASPLEGFLRTSYVSPLVSLSYVHASAHYDRLFSNDRSTSAFILIITMWARVLPSLAPSGSPSDALRQMVRLPCLQGDGNHFFAWIRSPAIHRIINRPY